MATSPSPANSSTKADFKLLYSLTYAVCKITDQDGGDKGTGFLIGPNLIMTCNHVIPDKETAEKCKACFYEYTEFDREPGGGRFRFEGAVVEFDTGGFFEYSEQKKTQIGKQMFADRAGQGKLDYTIATLKTHSRLQGLPAVFSLLEPPQAEGSAVAYVFQHPDVPDADTGLKGLFKATPGSFNTGNKSDYEVHYQTPTARGSSGGAVLNPQGQLIALHYWGPIQDCSCCREKDPDDKGKKPAKTSYCNAGVLINRILEDLERKNRLELLKNLIQTNPPVDRTQILNLPEPPREFTGRADKLEELHQICQQNNKVAICGLGGVGKTTLALKYAKENEKSFHWIHVFSSASFELVTQGLMSLADALSVPKGTSKERLAMLKVQLETRKETFLLIFDGIDQLDTLNALKTHLPNRDHILLLFTSRLKEQVGKLNFTLVPLGTFKGNEGRDFLIKAVNIDKKIGEEIDKDEKEAALLAETLGQFPLALTHAAAFIRSTPGYTFAKYSGEFDKEGVKLFEDDIYLDSEEQTILTTWEKSIEAIKTHHNCPLAQDILAFLSVLGHAPIPLEMVERWFQKNHGNLPQKDLRNALRHLQNYSLLESTSKTCSLHFLVQKVINDQLASHDRQRISFDALHIGAILCKGLNPKEVQVRKELQSLFPHLEALAASKENASEANRPDLQQVLKTLWGYYCHEGKYAASEKVARKLLEITQNDRSPEKGTALDQLGISLLALGRHQEALEHLQEALEIRGEALEEKHVDMATSWNNVGLALEALGRHQEALENYKKALEIWKESLGKEHPDVATSWSNVGAILEKLGRHKEALEHLQKALEISENALEKDPLLVATNWSNVGATLISLGRYQEALKNYERALEIWEKALGKKHPLVAKGWSNMGTTLAILGRHQEALEDHKKALKIYTEVLGEEHALVATSWNSVGMTLGALGHYQEALEDHKKALEISRKALGEEHPDVGTAWGAVGTTLRNLGKNQEALEPLQNALRIEKKALEKDPPNIALRWTNVGMILGMLGQPQDALEHLQKALEIWRMIFGEDHPLVAKSLNNVGTALASLGQHQEALKNHEKALEINRKVLGEEHPDVAVSLDCVGGTLRDLGQHQETPELVWKALENLQKALEIRKHTLGEDHHLVAISFLNVGTILRNLGQYAKALEYQKNALEISRKALGEEHPDVAIASCNLGKTLQALGQHQEALPYLQNAVKIGEARFGISHPDTLTFYGNLADCLNALERHKEAWFYREKVLSSLGLPPIPHALIADQKEDQGLLGELSRLQTLLTFATTLISTIQRATLEEPSCSNSSSPPLSESSEQEEK